MPALVSPHILPGGLRCHPQPTLIIDELVLRPWDTADVAAVVSAYRDPGIRQWHARTMTDDEALAWIRSWSERWQAETGAGWAVVDGDLVVGRVGFGAMNLAVGYGEVAYWVVPEARGRGIAARALSAATTWMFEPVGFHRLELLHSTRNEASCRVAEKAGYVYEGTARKQARHADGWHDMHVHARVDDDTKAPPISKPA